MSKGGPPQKPLGGFAGFVSAFGNEIGKDFGIVDSKKGKTARERICNLMLYSLERDVGEERRGGCGG